MSEIFLEDLGSFIIFTMWIKLKVHNLFTCDVTGCILHVIYRVPLVLDWIQLWIQLPGKLVVIELWSDEGNRIQTQ